jgi:hypothetical protein
MIIKLTFASLLAKISKILGLENNENDNFLKIQVKLK